jgi:glycosyltransferase involved in cell wall biosynthesis
VAGILTESRVGAKGAAREIAAARRRILAWDPDVVHAQDRRSGLICAGLGIGAALLRARPASRPAVVHTYHGVPDDVDQAWLDDPDAPAPSRYTRTVLAADAVVARTVDRTVVVADVLGRFLRDRLHVPAGRIRHIDNGLALPGPAATAREGPIRHLLFVGLLVERKGVDVLLRALQRALARGGPDDLHLSVVGDGPERAALERQATDLGLTGHVSFLGFRADVPAVMAGADAFVLPARMEQQPLVLIEAMASGLPVVATDVGGVREMLAEHGRVVAADDVEALAGELLTLTRLAPDRRAESARVATAYAHGRFSVEASLEAHLDLYRELREWHSDADAR